MAQSGQHGEDTRQARTGNDVTGEASTMSISSCRSQQYVRDEMAKSGVQGEDASGEWYGQAKIGVERVGPRSATKSGMHVNNVKAASSAQGVRSSIDVTAKRSAKRSCQDLRSRQSCWPSST